MSEQDAERIRDAIQRDQTSCRCGHLLAACADCRDWLIEHSPLIQMQWVGWWRLWHEYAEIATPQAHQGQWTADAAERYALRLYESRR